MKHMDTDTFVLFGHIAFTPIPEHFEIHPDSYLVCENGQVHGIYSSLPEKYQSAAVHNFRDCIIIPGLCDTHIHAPQYAFRGLGMDMELLDWLNTHTFPEESLYIDTAYAETAYRQFADALKNSATTRAAVFATVHIPATMCLMRLLEESGLACLVGKVNMNRNSPEELSEGDAENVLAQTENWICNSLAEFRYTKPIITPRFVISCTEKLMIGLGKLARKYSLPVQSHLSENKSEIEWVKELCPWADSYGDVYEIFDLLGGDVPTVMAHCVHSDDYEQKWLRSRGVLVSHCPSSNINLSSGIAPIRKYLTDGLPVSLGSDIAGGFDLSIFRAMTDAVQVSKVRSCYGQTDEKPLTISEAFYMGTKGASALFGKVGSFEPGYEFDAVVVNDGNIISPKPLTIKERLERMIYLEKETQIKAKYVSGRKIL